MAKARVTLVKSSSGFRADQEKTLRALGLRRMGDTREHDYSRSIRGMLEKVKHLVRIEIREETSQEEKSGA